MIPLKKNKLEMTDKGYDHFIFSQKEGKRLLRLSPFGRYLQCFLLSLRHYKVVQCKVRILVIFVNLTQPTVI